MSGPATAEPRTISAIPGRARVHLPAWSGRGQYQLEKRVRQVPGVRRAEANALTGNILVFFDPQTTDPNALHAALDAAQRETAAAPEEPPPPPVIEEENGRFRRARIAVRGLDRDPGVARRLVERLERRLGVHAHPSALTGRVLVEFDDDHTSLTDILAEIADVELPALPGEDRPAHPLDPRPLVQSATRTTGAASAWACSPPAAWPARSSAPWWPAGPPPPPPFWDCCAASPPSATACAGSWGFTPPTWFSAPPASSP